MGVWLAAASKARALAKNSSSRRLNSCCSCCGSSCRGVRKMLAGVAASSGPGLGPLEGRGAAGLRARGVCGVLLPEPPDPPATPAPGHPRVLAVSVPAHHQYRLFLAALAAGAPCWAGGRQLSASASWGHAGPSPVQPVSRLAARRGRPSRGGRKTGGRPVAGPLPPGASG